MLEGQAEGLNLINLLAAQWGDLYTNVGDLAHGPLISRDGETVVWPGTENRHHLMGHIGLLGGKGKPVFPLSGGFPYGYDEAYLGDPLWIEHVGVGGRLPRARGRDRGGALPVPAGGAGRGYRARQDRCGGSADAPVAVSGREVSGVVPVSELRLPAARGRRDGQDERQRGGGPLADVCAHRAGGVQLRGVGARRCGRATRFRPPGPLLLLRVDGRVPGDEIALGAGGGTVEVEAQARSFTPVHRLEIVVNGKVVASREEKGGARELVLREKVPVPAPGWIAARCESLPARPARWPRSTPTLRRST